MTSGASAATASAVGGGTPSTTSSSSSSNSSPSSNATNSVLRRAGTGTTSQSRPSSSSSSSMSLGNDICNSKGRNRKRCGSKVSFTSMTFLCAFLAAATMLSFLQQQQHRRRSGGATTPHSSSSHQQLRGGGSSRSSEKLVLPSPQHQPLWRRYLERAAHGNDKTGEGNGKGKTNKGTVAVTILFTSDVHGHYDSDRTSRLSYVIDTVRRATANNNDNDQEHFLLLDGGDSIFGSSHINETHVSSILNHLQYDAMALGNHEFDVGPTRLEQFADMVNFPILASNVIVDNKDRKGEQKKDKKESPVLTSSSSFVQGHTVLDLGHTSTKLGNVCLLGVTAKEYNPLVSKNIQFDDEIDSVNTLVSRLSGSARRRMLQKKSSSSSSTKNKESSSSMKKASSSKMIQKKKKEEEEKDVGAPPCQRTILLSHAGIDVDRMFVNALRKTTTKKKEEEEGKEKATRVDVVLGGHSHVLLGPPPRGVHSNEEEGGAATTASGDVETDGDDDDGGDDAPDAEYGYILKDASLPSWSSSKRRRSVNDKEVPKGGEVGGPPFLVHAGSNGRHAALLRLEYDYDDVAGGGEDGDSSSGGERKLELASAHGELVPLDEEHFVLTDPTFDAWWNERIAPTLLKDGEGGAAAGGAAGPVRYADIRIVDAGEGNKKRHKKRYSSSGGGVDKETRRVCNQACRSGECFSGNLVTDAMRACVEHGPCKAHVPTTVHLKVPSAEDADGTADKGEPYIVGTMALLESGTLRGCIAPSGRKESFDEMLPWPNALVLMVMDGATVRRMLEHGIRSLPPGKRGANNNDNNKGGGRQGGAFLQVSGLQYRYDGTDDDDGGTVRAAWLTEEKTRRPPSSPRSSGRVTFTDDATSTASCRVSSSVSTQIDLDDASRYLVVVSDWLASGGDGFGDVVSSAETVVSTDIPLRETLLNYTTTSPTIQYESRSARGTGASSSSALRQAISGFLGGAVAFIVTYPVYTAFVRRSMHKTVHGSLSRLFDGAALGTLATALSNAIYFVVYNSASIASMSAFSRSSIAAIANSVVTSPLWVIVTREQLSLDKAGAWAVAQAVYKEEGIRGFFDGLSTNLLMCVFPVVRQIALELIVDLLAITHQNDVALAASGASLVATIVTFPIQKWRIRLQSGEKDSSKRSIWHECCDGVAFKVMDSCLKTFVLFLVKEHSDMIMCILEG